MRWRKTVPPQIVVLRERPDPMTELPQVDLESLDFEYGISAEYHFFRSQEIIKTAKTYAEVIYASLELRQAIERLAFEYLVLVNNHLKVGLSRPDLKKYLPKDLLRRLGELEPDIDKKIDFMNITLQSCGMNFNMLPPDVPFLVETHGRIGKMLHLQRNNVTKEEQVGFVRWLQDAHLRLRPYILDRGIISKLKPHAEDILSKYLAGEITRDQVQRMLTLSTLPLHLYNQEEPRE